jgi:hypothetical protein
VSISNQIDELLNIDKIGVKSRFAGQHRHRAKKDIEKIKLALKF